MQFTIDKEHTMVALDLITCEIGYAVVSSCLLHLRYFLQKVTIESHTRVRQLRTKTFAYFRTVYAC